MFSKLSRGNVPIRFVKVEAKVETKIEAKVEAKLIGEFDAPFRLKDRIDPIRHTYDFVIVDTPPILAVTDPTSIAPRVDGVLLAMRLSRHTRDLGRRTLEQLRDVGATMAGIVINGVEESDGYGYGSYRYSDYQYYYKSYDDGYGHERNAKEDYFSEDRSESIDADILL